jgi:hypothetical protein
MNLDGRTDPHLPAQHIAVGEAIALTHRSAVPTDR